ncbi:MAG: glutaredoxin domain-containing protein, partial [Nanoarchaeota archaeon]
MDEATKHKIESMIKSEKVFLFMKGTPEYPECGFSMRVVQILKSLNVKFGSFNILEDETMRQSIKEY